MSRHKMWLIPSTTFGAKSQTFILVHSRISQKTSIYPKMNQSGTQSTPKYLGDERSRLLIDSGQRESIVTQWTTLIVHRNVLELSLF